MIKDSEYKKIKIETLAVPKKNGLFQCMHNFYWAVTDDECVLFFKGMAPQANMDKTIMDHYLDSLPKFVKEIKLIENIFIPIYSNDFEYCL